jgi:hypothetical protein
MKTLLHETDWLASTPAFYDLRQGKANTSIQALTPVDASPVFNPEGLYNYLDFGYSVLEQTPLANIRFMRHSSRLWRTDSGKLEVEYLNDPFDRYIDYRLSESDIIELIRERVQSWESSLPADRELVLPLSGGFDSRLLLWCLDDPSRVRAYTYGLSENQSRSTEVVHAQRLAKLFGVCWEQIPLGNFHNYFDDWDAEFGISTHAHGMYHFEFYTKIREHLKGEHAFLSGIFGDVWAGSILPNPIDNFLRLSEMGYTHGLCADASKLNIAVKHNLRKHFWSDHGERLDDHRYQVITTIRLKIILISYLMRVPRLFGFKPWTPYLDIDIAMAMLNLPKERRYNRQWQRDFFRKVGLNLEEQKLLSSKSNTLNYQALKRRPLPPLDCNLLREVIDSHYINSINHNLRLTPFNRLRNKLLGGRLRRLGFQNKFLEAYYAYLCLKPIESVLKKSSIKMFGR